MRRIRERLRTELRSLRGANAAGGDQTAQPDHPGVGRLLPDAGIRRHVRQSGSLPVEAHLQVGQLSHPNKPKLWVVARYFGKFNKSGRTAGCLATATAAPTCTSSPGPESSDTRSSRRSVTRRPRPGRILGVRRRKAPLPINNTTRRLTEAQDGRCAICGGTLYSPSRTGRRHPSEWEHWLAITRATIQQRTQRHDGRRRTPSHTRPLPSRPAAWHFCPPTSLGGLLEPDAGKLARPVLRGARRSNAPGLPDTLGGGARCRGGARFAREHDRGAAQLIWAASSAVRSVPAAIKVAVANSRQPLTCLFHLDAASAMARSRKTACMRSK